LSTTAHPAYDPAMIIGLPILILVIVFIVLVARGTFSKKD